MRKRMMLALVAGLMTMMLLSGIASAHVHGITPLRGLDCNVDNTITGGNRADDNNTPISGLIPRDVGEAPLTGGDGGSGATTANCS